MKELNLEAVRERMIQVVEEDAVSPAGRKFKKYEWIEFRTGVAARKWQNLVNKTQMPTFEMICGLTSMLQHDDFLYVFYSNTAKMAEKEGDQGFAAWQLRNKIRKESGE